MTTYPTSLEGRSPRGGLPRLLLAPCVFPRRVFSNANSVALRHATSNSGVHMLVRTSRFMTVLVPMAVLTFVLAACGSGEPDSSGASVLAGANGGSDVVEEWGESYPLPDCTGQDPATCSYDGFDPLVDGFSFANWGETGQLGATGLIALFGKSEVCATFKKGRCVLYPAAKEWAEQVNEAMAGGHCEGMAVMAARLFRGDDDLQDLDPAAESTFDLLFEDPDVASAIDT